MSNDGNVYDKAREVLRERGWTRDTLVGGDGSVCLVGALAMAVNAKRGHFYAAAEPYADPLLLVINEQYPCLVPRTDIVKWNDQEAESVADVDLVLDKAARAWDEQHSGGTR